MRIVALTASAILLSATSGFAAESVTTRIEPRPVYGAVVTVEKGVRVYRPLPPHDRVIVNPTQAPIYFGIEQPAPGVPYALPRR